MSEQDTAPEQEQGNGDEGFIGVDAAYRNYADKTKAPLLASDEEKKAYEAEQERFERDAKASGVTDEDEDEGEQPKPEDYPVGATGPSGGDDEDDDDEDDDTSPF
jgi:hypothetical protein